MTGDALNEAGARALSEWPLRPETWICMSCGGMMALIYSGLFCLACDDDAAKAAYYSYPPNLETSGPGRKPRRQQLTETVPVRFDEDVAAAVRKLADANGMTVSAWVRRIVAAEIERRDSVST